MNPSRLRGRFACMFRAMWACAALLLLAGCASMRMHGDVGNAVDARLRIVTFNLYHDKADWPARRMLVVEQLRALDPDVIALQEVLGHETLRNQAEDLAEALGYHVYFVSTDPEGQPRRYGNALLTRAPMLGWDWVRLRPLQDSRTAGHVRIDVAGHPVALYVTHLNYRDDADGARMRSEQLQDLLAFIDRTADGAPAIVMGDFNATSNRPEITALSARFANAYDALHPGANSDQAAHTTLNPRYFPQDQRRIDHVYLQRDAWQPVEANIVLDRPDAQGHWPSDHFGMFVELRLARGAETR